MIFEVEPNYVKGDRFSAKIIETGRSRSFAFSMIYGVFDTRAEAEKILSQMRAFQDREKEISDLDAEREKKNEKLELLNERYEKTEEQIEKKEDAFDKLEYKDSHTDSQAERFKKLPQEIDKLREKESKQYKEIEEVEKEISKLDDLVDSKQSSLDEDESVFREERYSDFKAKLSSLDIEVREATPKQSKRPVPESHSKLDTEKHSFFSKLKKIIIGRTRRPIQLRSSLRDDLRVWPLRSALQDMRMNEMASL